MTTATYNVLHNIDEGDENNEDTNEPEEFYDEDELDELEYKKAHHKRKADPIKDQFESLDFTDAESMMWRKVSYPIFNPS
jgi:hypothetical protein